MNQIRGNQVIRQNLDNMNNRQERINKQKRETREERKQRRHEERVKRRQANGNEILDNRAIVKEEKKQEEDSKFSNDILYRLKQLQTKHSYKRDPQKLQHDEHRLKKF